MYFNNSSIPSPNSSDTSDFLSFSGESSPGGSPQNRNFCPSNFSSPVATTFHGKLYRNRAGRNYHFKPNKGYGGQYQRKHGYKGEPVEEVSVPGNGGYSEQAFYKGHHHNNNFKNRRHNNFKSDVSVFFDPSCLEDPWQDLEKRQASDNQIKLNISSDVSSQSIEVEMKEFSSTEASSNDSEDGSEEMENSFS